MPEPKEKEKKRKGEKKREKGEAQDMGQEKMKIVMGHSGPVRNKNISNTMCFLIRKLAFTRWVREIAQEQ